MRLLILDQFSELGGAQQCLLDLLPAIRERGWRACLGLPGNGPLAARVLDAGFETAPIDCAMYSNGRKTASDLGRFVTGTPRLARQISEIAERFRADAIYVNGPRLLPAVGAGRPVIFHAHRIVPRAAERLLCGWRLRRTRASVIGVCRFAADPWAKFVGAERISVIYNGVAGPQTLPERRMDGPPRIGCIGRIAPEKGQLEFVRAAALIHRAIPECRFAIYGAAVIADPDYEHKVRAAAGGLPIEFAGWTDDVQDALANLDVLLTPSDPYEATTRVILESFAAGTPVVAFPSGGIPEVIDHGRTGLLANGAEEMAQAAIALLRDECRRGEIARQAREIWRARFTVERWREAVLNFIESASQ